MCSFSRLIYSGIYFWVFTDYVMPNTSMKPRLLLIPWALWNYFTIGSFSKSHKLAHLRVFWLRIAGYSEFVATCAQMEIATVWLMNASVLSIVYTRIARMFGGWKQQFRQSVNIPTLRYAKQPVTNEALEDILRSTTQHRGTWIRNPGLPTNGAATFELIVDQNV